MDSGAEKGDRTVSSGIKNLEDEASSRIIEREKAGLRGLLTCLIWYTNTSISSSIEAPLFVSCKCPEMHQAGACCAVHTPSPSHHQENARLIVMNSPPFPYPF